MSDGNSGKEDGGASSLQRVDLDKAAIRRLQSEPPRPIVVVLGMHRSGTSLLSNILHLLGVDMADMTDHVSPKNAGGFWERPALVEIQDEVLEAIGRPIGKPSHVLPFPPAWWRRKEVQALKPKLADYLRQQLHQTASPWGFKDPRTSRLLPLWWEVFREVNVEPIYIHAIRNAAEASVSMANKSKARRVSPSTGELMWLSYNYDIVRYVTVKQPPILIDYDDWFEDAVGTARRFVDALGIGGDLSAEELDECVKETVRADYRNHTAREDKAEATIPIADMLYRALTNAEGRDSGDVRQLRAQMRLADLFFKSVRPLVENLDAAVAAETEEKERVAEREAAAQQSLAETGQRLAQAQEEHQRTKEQLKQLEEKHQSSQEQLKQLEEERHAYQEQLKQFQEAHQKSQEQLMLLEEEHRRSSEQVTQLQDEHRRAVDEAALARASAAAAEERAKGTEEERKRALDDAAAARHAASVAEKSARDSGEVARERELERNKIRAALEQRESELAQSRDAIREEQRKATALSKRLQARERELADARAAAVLRETGASVFAWPSAGDEAPELQASMESDARGIRGAVRFADRPDLVPVIEVRVDGELVAAQFCAQDGATAAEGWPFDIPWSRISDEHAGKEAIVKVAGVERELGRAPIPDDLHDYHVAPAALASKLLGGTVAEASEYHRWILESESHRDVDLARTYYSDAKTNWPTITVVVFGGDEVARAATLQSLREQVYRDWGAIVVGELPEEAEPDARVRTLRKQDLEAALDSYAADALLTFVEAGDTLSQTALLHLATAAQQTPGFSLIYSDEDRIEPRSGVRGLPHMKGEWSPDLALSSDYVTRLALVRRGGIRDLKKPNRAGVYKIALRAALSGEGPVIHLPFVLYHRSASNVREHHDLAAVVEAVVAESPTMAQATVVRLPCGRWKIQWPLPDPLPTVSLVVPTRDRVDLLRVCVEGFLDNTNYANLEVLIADNDSEEEETKSYLREISNRPRVRVIPCPGSFNFSRINNLAVSQASGSVIGLMNNDLKVIDPDWLRHMVAHVVRPDVGIVGAKLLHADDTVQHAGVTLGIGVASHLYKSFPRDAEGHHGRLVLAQDLSAVTAACLLMRRDVWDEVGGLDEIFPIAYNDVDLCLKVTAHGYRVLWTPEAVVYHLESQSRGKETTPEKRERLEQEKAQLIERWGERVTSDPFYSPNLSAKAVDARLAFPPRATPPWRPLAA